MNKVLISFLFSTSLLTASTFAQTPPPAEPAVVPATSPVVKPARHDHHPEIHKAMRKLRGAKTDLEKAAHDYAGHKAKAIAAIDEALEELHAAIISDKD